MEPVIARRAETTGNGPQVASRPEPATLQDVAGPAGPAHSLAGTVGLPPTRPTTARAERPTPMWPAPAPTTRAAAPTTRAAARDGAARTQAAPEQEGRVLATATYVTGTARLEPGQRYGIAIRGSRFQVLGPVDLEPRRVALERPVADLQVSALEGRLVVSEQTRSGVVLAFMAIAGAAMDELAVAIRAAARDAGA